LSVFGVNRKIDNNVPQGGPNNGLVNNLTTSPKGVPYNAHFAPERVLLSAENMYYFDLNVE
jgi:hypothetical protein